MDKTERFWDKQAVRFEAQADKPDPTLDKALEHTKKYLHENDVLLDYACGIGTSSCTLSDHVKEIVAIDISQGMIDIANKNKRKLDYTNIRFKKASIYDDEFEKGLFDMVTAFNILHLVEDCKQDIRRIYELLKPGGYFISSTACLGEKSLLRFIFKCISVFGFVPNLKTLTISDLKEAMLKEGFAIIEEKIFPHSATLCFMVVRKN